MDKIILKLFIAGNTSRSARAAWNLKKLCQTVLAGRSRMTVIDVLEEPQAAEDEQIIATPTLVKVMPPPQKRLIGDLSDQDQVVRGLDLFDLTQSGNPKEDSDDDT